MKQLFEQAQYLVDDAQNIRDRIAKQGGKDAIPLSAIVQDMADIMYKFSKLRLAMLERIK